MAKYGSEEQFLNKFNPSLQVACFENQQLSIEGNYPTLVELELCYKKDDKKDDKKKGSVPKQWITAQLYNLFMYANCDKEFSTEQFVELVTMIYSSFKHLKVTELMLFFYKFKKGEYGQFYKSIDPIKITKGLEKFIEYRDSCIQNYDSLRLDKMRQRQKRDAVPCPEHIRRKWVAMGII